MQEIDKQEIDKQAKQLNEALAPLSLLARIELIAKKFPQAIFTTSLGLEDQVLTWAIAQQARELKIITLQTGRLFAETNELLAATKNRFSIDIAQITPDAAALKNYIEKFGIDGFYESIAARKACCDVRKVAPLRGVLKGTDAWITGLRSSQSQNRADIDFVSWDKSFSVMKFNPLADFVAGQISLLVAKYDIPINPLHQRNYPSIGCEPCTRAIKSGEHERAGRWWWESDQKQECGLHVSQANLPQTDLPRTGLPKTGLPPRQSQ